MENERKRVEYANDNIVVVWQPHLCVHSGVCIRTLPQVFRPGDTPWIKLENSSTDKIIAQINKCPSGALSYRRVQ